MRREKNGMERERESPQDKAAVAIGRQKMKMRGNGKY